MVTKLAISSMANIGSAGIRQEMSQIYATKSIRMADPTSDTIGVGFVLGYSAERNFADDGRDA